ncbi:DNA mismatch repair protein [Chitinophaga pollutisoli]|uniref:DNA mismatch repair protein n=1 Tax=Chitinophaga pollutisoli TaxID=3133966 RepID=A0ABZ2YRX3_9BACT
MAFSIDQQTINDLDIFNKEEQRSIFGLFNRCATIGGAAVLEEMFRKPLSDEAAINRRASILRYFAAQAWAFPFKSAYFDEAERYLANRDERTRLSARQTSLAGKVAGIIAPAVAEKQMLHAVQEIVSLIRDVSAFISRFQLQESDPYQGEIASIRAILKLPAFRRMLAGKDKLPADALAGFDTVLRFRYRDEMRRLLLHLYEMDAYISAGKVAASQGFVFPRTRSGEALSLQLRGVFHPLVKNAVPNTVEMTASGNFIFLTGANMAGKSTFMKCLGTALYLAHIGFPVPAASMEFTVMDGMFTTINLPDNLGAGASHFYAEVLRVKKIVQEVNSGKRLFIIFDELFRGTNVKDAYDGTVAVAGGFARRKNSFFVISTHIIEAGAALKNTVPDMQFLFLPTFMNGTHPVYSYKLEAGITNDRHGMVIIQNEGILSLLAAGLRKKSVV